VFGLLATALDPEPERGSRCVGIVDWRLGKKEKSTWKAALLWEKPPM